MFQHTAARRRLQLHFLSPNLDNKFQHTAARRRLPLQKYLLVVAYLVSTHSRPKAAAYGILFRNDSDHGFNTQPPEGGCPNKADESKGA